MLSHLLEWQPATINGKLNAMIVTRRLMPEIVAEIMRLQFDNPKLQRIKGRVIAGDPMTSNYLMVSSTSRIVFVYLG